MGEHRDERVVATSSARYTHLICCNADYSIVLKYCIVSNFITLLCRSIAAIYLCTYITYVVGNFSKFH